MQDERPPLNGASDTVWKDLDQLRKQVKDLCGAISSGIGDTGNAGNAGEDLEGELLHRLLRKIDDVRNLQVHVTRSESPSHNGDTEERPSGAVDEGSSSSTPITETSEDEHVFERACDFYLLIPRAYINLQPELDSDCHTLSSPETTVQSAFHVETIESDATPMFKSRGPTTSSGPPIVGGQNPQSVTSGPRRNAPIVLPNPIISLLSP